MSKGLIDLKRANNPPENPLSGEPAEADQAATAAITANANEPAAPPATVVAEAAQVASPTTTERVSTIGARIPESLHQTIKLFCIANRIEMQHFVQEALTLHLQRLQDNQQT